MRSGVCAFAHGIENKGKNSACVFSKSMKQYFPGQSACKMAHKTRSPVRANLRGFSVLAPSRLTKRKELPGTEERGQIHQGNPPALTCSAHACRAEGRSRQDRVSNPAPGCGQFGPRPPILPHINAPQLRDTRDLGTRMTGGARAIGPRYGQVGYTVPALSALWGARVAGFRLQPRLQGNL